MKRIILICMLVVLMMTGCAKKCRSGCGKWASPKCSAGMCDDCCAYYEGLTGCRHTEFN